MDHTITVIIPMFNEDKSINGCIAALQQQSTQNFSVIFVDDGSTDQTLPLLKKTLNQSNILFNYKILLQENQGAAKARETAICNCETPYALVFDADDYISSDTIEKNIACILQYHCDISIPNFEVQQKDGTYNTLAYPDDRNAYTGMEALQYTLGKWQVPGIMCAKTEIFIQSYNLYRQFNPKELNFVNNDEVINRLNFYFAKQVVRNDSYYYYNNNPNSTTKKINPNRYLMAKNVQILYQLFGKDMGEISHKMQEEYVNVLWDLIKYSNKNKRDLPNISLWVAEIKSLIKLMPLNRKAFCAHSFKTKSRILLSLIMAKLL